MRDSVPAVRRDSVQASAAPGSGRWSIILPGITFAPETRWAAAIGGFKVTKSAPSPGQRPNTYAVRGLYSQRHQV